MERRRVATERVEHNDGGGDREEADLARPGSAADQPERDERDDGERAGIKQSHVLGEIQSRRSPGRIPERAFRRPIIDLGIHRPEQIGERELQEMNGVQRSRCGRCVADLGAVRTRRQQRGHGDRYRGDDRGGSAGCDQRPDAGAYAGEPLLADDPIRQHETGEHIEGQEGDLIATHRQQPDNGPGGDTRLP